MNIVAPVLFQCKLSPLSLAIYVPGSPHGPVTYGALERFIHGVARMSADAGIAPGTVVGLHVRDTVLHIALSLGLMHSGVTTLSLRGPQLAPEIMPDIVLTDVPGQVSGDATFLVVDHSWIALGAQSEAMLARGGGDDPCRIILTSGSTGVSKGVMLSHRAMAARTMAYSTQRGARFAQCSRLFCDLSLPTSPGIHYLLSMLGRGGTIYFLGPDPFDILQIISLHSIQGMATSPYGLSEFLKFFEADTAFDATFDHIICQGAMLSPQLSERARARLCQNLYVSYGATETSTVAFGPAAVCERMPGAVGYIQPGAVVEAVDPAGNVLPALRDGVIRIQSHQMAQGYVKDAEATALMFRDGYFYTGDVGHLTADGLLVITGREKTALNIGGDTISPERVEEVIAAFPGIKDAGVFSRDNELGISELHALIVADTAIDEEMLRQHCAGRLPPSCAPGSITRVAALPRGGQGKLERHRFPAMAVARETVA